MDRESREVVDIIDEIQETLALEVSPINYPIGKGNDFIGCYELNDGNIELLIKQNKNLPDYIYDIDQVPCTRTCYLFLLLFFSNNSELFQNR